MTVVPFPQNRARAARAAKGKAMDVILHIGAHRCATTTFQHYMRDNADRLQQQGIGFWGPYRTRTGLFRGIAPGVAPATERNRQRRAGGRIRLNLARSAASGVQQLVVSEENMLGSMRGNLREAELYPAAGERMARYGQAFGDAITDVVLNIRSLEHYWASAMGYGLYRGRGIPGDVTLDWIARSPRTWRDVVTDVACAMPDARLWVLPFETFAGRPDAQLKAVTGRQAPREHSRSWYNATPRLPQLRASLPAELAEQLPDGVARWNPFSQEQTAQLREAYADDLMWLAAGAEGLAWLMNDPEQRQPKDMAGQRSPRSELTRGRRNDQDRRMAGAG